MDEKERRPLLVEQWPRLLPGCYEALDALDARRGAGGLPVSAVYLYLFDVCRSQQQAGMLASELTACWLWQRGGAVRAFAPEQAAALARQAQEGSLRQLPAGRLLALSGITYCETPGLLEMMEGFFCWINEETARPPELRVQWLAKGQKQSVTQRLPLPQGMSLRDCFYTAFPAAYGPEDGPGHQQAKKMAEMLWRAVPFVLELLPPPAQAAPTAPADTKKKRRFWQR